MSDGGIMVLDGNTLRLLHVSLPEDRVTLTGAQVLDFAESEASQSLFGISLPPHLKSSSLRRINIDGVDDDTSFRSTELRREEGSRKLSDYLSAIADELKGSISCLEETGMHFTRQPIGQDRTAMPMQAPPLFPIQPLSAGKLLQKLHHYHLKNYCNSNDCQKQLVLMYPLEDVLFLQLPCIELIKHLAEDKGVEDEGVIRLTHSS
ncbi:CALCIUM-BINDING EF HAND FAMILY PROTEIN [Salix koriyanagi]|uniref:CALCIUM-BINDING EF HAND FAMILY PROTEIN n=1 Tax=Salix koriyanagi TaxID=2511006 RepID=A0A9Q0SMI1_9ROSI|nr:CALCIUM-BINDING EF HAND FAMILY PROTEIN [Salix koriyanagi]